MRHRTWCVCGALVVAAFGCADMRHPVLRDYMRHPWTSADDLQIGLSQAAVRQQWGEPDERRVLRTDQLGTRTEEWVYHAAVVSVPVQYMYLSKTRRLVFEGDNLVRWSAD